MRGIALFGGVVALTVLIGLAQARLAAEPQAKTEAKAEGKKPAEKSGGLPDLAAALKEIPGCLGVETAKTSSGKSVIFAWFEDKKAALAWYNSDVHREAMKLFLPDYKSGRKPLADVPDNSGPIMVVASITPNDKPTKENPAPFKQIAIEIYQPLGDGLDIGGRFAPEKMKVMPRKEEPKK